jgi:uncharacterized cupin superfamily protein
MSVGSKVAPVSWIEVPPSWQTGEGLVPYTGETAHMLDWVENMNGKSRHLFAHAGQLIVDVVEIEPNAVHQLGKAADEIVVVINGVLNLITDATKVEQNFKAGEMVMFRAGWAGIYRVMSDDGPFRELAIVPHDYFDASKAPPVSRETPRRIEMPIAVGTHELYRNTYLVEAQNTDRAKSWPITAVADQVIQVLAGSVTLASAGTTALFGPGSVVILPKGFSGEASATAGYRALSTHWNG